MKRLSLVVMIMMMAGMVDLMFWDGQILHRGCVQVAVAQEQKIQEVDQSPTPEKKADEEKAVEEEKADDPNTVEKDKPDDKQDAEKKDDKKEEKKDDGEALNLKDVEMKVIIPKLAEWTGKVIIPHQDVMGQRLTIFSPRKLERDEAMKRIYDALREKGFVAEEADGVIFIKPIKDAKTGQIPTISSDGVLALIENKNQVVQKFFQLHNYSPTQLQQIVLPLIPDYGYVSADESTGQLVVIDTVANLMRIETIIQQLDIPEAGDTITETFEVAGGDPSEIVQLLRILLTGDQMSYRRDRNRDRYNRRPPRPGVNGSAATSVVIGTSMKPIILIPEIKRKWIIAKAAAEDMELIRDWIAKLDTKQPVTSEHTIRPINYADVREVADQINRMIQQMPGSELQTNVLVQPLEQARQVMIVGSDENREMVEKLIDEIDIPTDMFITKHFDLNYADAEQVKQYIDELYDENASNTGRGYYNYYSYNRRGNSMQDADTVRTIAYSTLKKLTVIASEENMVQIAKQIEEWDKPINTKDVAPLIIDLQNSDPVEMSDLLSKLFSEDSTSNSRAFYNYYSSGMSDMKKIVGPLYGQLTFEPVPETKKIIVISKIPEAYEVIKDLILKLDKQEPAELPMVVVLKYADCEDLCEQLNSILNETGTPASVRRREQGLTEYDESGNTQQQGNRNNNNNNNNNNNRNAQNSAGAMSFWWSNARTNQDQMPTSNLLGKIRFIPVHRSKAILVLSPSEYQESIREIISELDKPAKQVMVKAIIVEVSHDDLTSIGVQYSTNGSALGAAGENSFRAMASLVYDQILTTTEKVTSTLNATMTPELLVDFLVKNARGRVLNQPTLWTKDNEQAEFFKGKNVAFKSLSSESSEGGKTTDSYDYKPVGLTLRVRPNITPAKDVDVTIHLNISQVEPEMINGEIATNDFTTTTHMIVQDGETILISGILYQNDVEIKKKVPLLGDIPLLGELFKYKGTQQVNSELMAFITPYVIDGGDTSAEADSELDRAREKMNSIKGALDQHFEPLQDDQWK